MNKHILALYETIMDELEKQGLADTQVDIEFLPNKSFLNQMVRITVRNWDNGRNASYVLRLEELEIKEIRAMDVLNYLIKEIKNDIIYSSRK